ncbi:hypothetical protein [Crateriforma spongiae]|uniref:hypothetical protein n=1 Tax=Crateriforma spongiae TaxID=2724528 RepID=UPI0039B097CA
MPDETLADVSTGLIWCNSCHDFRAGERIETRESVETLLAQAIKGELPDPYRFIFDDDPVQIDNYRESLRRTLHWMDLRKLPAQCLTCFSSDITHVSSALNEGFIDGRGRTATYSHVFASTGIDHRLSLYDLECNYLGEVSRICPETSDFIDDGYAYDKIVEMLKQQNGRDRTKR